MGEACIEVEINILAELRPFLPNEPPLADILPAGAAEAMVATKEHEEMPQPALQNAAPEEHAVRAILSAHGRATSLHAAGIALMQAMLHQDQQWWTEGIAEQTLALASALGCSWRPEGKYFSRF